MAASPDPSLDTNVLDDSLQGYQDAAAIAVQQAAGAYAAIAKALQADRLGLRQVERMLRERVDQLEKTTTAHMAKLDAHFSRLDSRLDVLEQKQEAQSVELYQRLQDVEDTLGVEAVPRQAAELASHDSRGQGEDGLGLGVGLSASDSVSSLGIVPTQGPALQLPASHASKLLSHSPSRPGSRTGRLHSRAHSRVPSGTGLGPSHSFVASLPAHSPSPPPLKSTDSLFPTPLLPLSDAPKSVGAIAEDEPTVATSTASNPAAPAKAPQSRKSSLGGHPAPAQASDDPAQAPSSTASSSAAHGAQYVPLEGDSRPISGVPPVTGTGSEARTDAYRSRSFSVPHLMGPQADAAHSNPFSPALPGLLSSDAPPPARRLDDLERRLNALELYSESVGRGSYERFLMAQLHTQQAQTGDTGTTAEGDASNGAKGKDGEEGSDDQNDTETDEQEEEEKAMLAAEAASPRAGSPNALPPLIAVPIPGQGGVPIGGPGTITVAEHKVLYSPRKTRLEGDTDGQEGEVQGDRDGTPGSASGSGPNSRAAIRRSTTRRSGVKVAYNVLRKKAPSRAGTSHGSGAGTSSSAAGAGGRSRVVLGELDFLPLQRIDGSLDPLALALLNENLVTIADTVDELATSFDVHVDRAAGITKAQNSQMQVLAQRQHAMQEKATAEHIALAKDVKEHKLHFDRLVRELQEGVATKAEAIALIDKVGRSEFELDIQRLHRADEDIMARAVQRDEYKQQLSDLHRALLEDQQLRQQNISRLAAELQRLSTEVSGKASKADLVHVASVLNSFPKVHRELEGLKAFVSEQITTQSETLKDTTVEQRQFKRTLMKLLSQVQEEMHLRALLPPLTAVGTGVGASCDSCALALRTGSLGTACLACATTVNKRDGKPVALTATDREFAAARGGGFLMSPRGPVPPRTGRRPLGTASTPSLRQTEGLRTQDDGSTQGVTLPPIDDPEALLPSSDAQPPQEEAGEAQGAHMEAGQEAPEALRSPHRPSRPRTPSDHTGGQSSSSSMGGSGSGSVTERGTTATGRAATSIESPGAAVARGKKRSVFAFAGSSTLKDDRDSALRKPLMDEKQESGRPAGLAVTPSRGTAQVQPPHPGTQTMRGADGRVYVQHHTRTHKLVVAQSPA